MTPENFARLKEILLTVRRLPPDKQAPYVAAACDGDPAFRAEVEQVLGQDSASLEIAPSLRFDSLAAAPQEALGSELPERVGPYRILGILGMGGMGVVYRAEQTEPIRREVALKLVRPGFDSQRIAARFELERQTLALMDHPHIARVLDAGTVDGAPYFAMELVRGMPVTDYCRENRLPLRRRLALFRTICGAVQHAHQKGVIHRDLKPSNILVETYDGQPVPRVIDFGIAKAVEPEAAAPALTRDGQLLGTLEYMSPEQAQGLYTEIDTRTDVYSLGVLLYELLSETLPFRLAGLSFTAALRMIVEEPPPAISRQDGGRLDADVATIVRKAMEKEPDRRYATAAALADDVDRFLRSEPIAARPPNWAYQLRKLVGRHRAPFATLLTSMVLILAFSGVVTWMLGKQTRESRRAEREERKAKHTLEFLEEALSSSTADALGGEATVRQALDAARKKLDAATPEEPEIEYAVRIALADTYMSLSRSPDAETQYRLALRACDRYPRGSAAADRALALQDLGAAIYYQGRRAEAESLTTRALEIRRAVAEDEGVAELLNNLGAMRIAIGDVKGAERALRESIELTTRLNGGTFPPYTIRLHNLAQALEQQGRFAESEPLRRRALELSRKVGDEMPVGFDALRLGTFLDMRGAYEEAEPLLNESITVLDRCFGKDINVSAAVMRTELGLLRLHTGSYAAAESAFRQSLAIEDQLPSPPTGAARVGPTCGLGESLKGQARFAEAESVDARALSTARGDKGSKALTALSLRCLASLRSAQGDVAEAESLLREAVALPGETPGDHVEHAWVFLDLGMLLLEENRPEEAEKVLRDCLAALAACGRSDWWPAAVAKNELACALAGSRAEESARLWNETRDVLAGKRSPVAFEIRRRALGHTLHALEGRRDIVVATAYAEEIERMRQPAPVDGARTLAR